MSAQLSTQVHRTELLDYTFAYRQLTRLEYRNLLFEHGEDVLALEDALCQLAVVSKPETFQDGTPWNWDTCPAGIPNTLAHLVLEASAFGDQERSLQLFSQAREEMLQQENRWDTMIAMAMPGTPLQEIWGWPPEIYFLQLARSELILNSVLHVDEEIVRRLLIPTNELKALLQQERGPGRPSQDEVGQALAALESARR